VIEATKGGVTLASTTATQEQLNEAMGITAEELAAEAAVVPAEGKDTPPAGEAEPAKAETDPDSDPDDKGETEEQRKRKGGWQRKIEKQDRVIEEQRLAIARLEALVAGKEPAKTETPAKAPETEDPEPSEDLNPKTGKPWKDWREFNRAHTEWVIRQNEAKAQQRSAQESDQAELEKNFNAHAERIKAAETKYGDWNEVAETVGKAELSSAVGLAIIELDNGTDVLYKLAKDPELLKQVQGMSDVRAIAKIGAISETLAATSSKDTATKDKTTSPPKEKLKSSAPAPINPVDGSSATATKDPSKLPLHEYVKQRNAGLIK
jgi:hypothetical protein